VNEPENDMKTIFDADTQAELVDRIGRLTPDTERQWGKMTACQMMEHTARVLEMATSEEQPIKQIFLGKTLGWMFKKVSWAKSASAKTRRRGLIT